MSVLIEKLNTTFTAELPPDISAKVCRNFFTVHILRTPADSNYGEDRDKLM